MPRVMRVQRISLAKSGLAKDNTVNTFYFQQAGASGVITTAEATAVCAELDTLFNTAVGGGSAVRLFIAESQHASQRTAYKCYNMDDPSPRTPFAAPPAQNVTPAITQAPLPPEVACCLSFQGAAVSGANMARRRGRVYIGPLNAAALAVDTTTGVAVVVAALSAALTAGANRMRDNLLALATPWDWVIYSPTTRAGGGTAASAVNVAVTAWVDDAFDTQRRRGQDPKIRTSVTL